MGIIFSRVRKKQSAIETLEKLDNDIKEIEESRTNAQKKYKRITKLLLVFSLGLYVICGVIFYFQGTSLEGKLLYLVPLAISPLLLYVIKRIISWYFVRVINKNQLRLNEMRKEKKKILEEVMDKETYKVAKEILEKYSNESAPKQNYNKQLVPSLKQADGGLRKRIVNESTSYQNRQHPNTVMRNFPGHQLQPVVSSPAPMRTLPGLNTPMMRLPAPILPLHRSYVDKVVEYLIGDGPNNRYALICSQCHSHNGMALKEEFEYMGFKCCYCYFFNPARKVRPEAPKLESPLTQKQDSDSDSERTSGEVSEGEHKITLGDKSTNVNESLESSSVKNGVECITDSSTNQQNENVDEETNSNTQTELTENNAPETEDIKQNFAEGKCDMDQPDKWIK